MWLCSASGTAACVRARTSMVLVRDIARWLFSCCCWVLLVCMCVQGGWYACAPCCTSLRAHAGWCWWWLQALYEASKRAKGGAGTGARGAAAGHHPPERLDKRTLMQEAFTERMREQQVCREGMG